MLRSPLASIDDRPCPAGAISVPSVAVGIPVNKALSAAEDGEWIQPAVAVIVLVFITIVFLDGDADVVGHEANGEGVE